MRRLWLLFAQTVTVALALWFIVATLKPEWLARPSAGIELQSTTVPVREADGGTSSAQTSYRQASERAMPTVVNIFTTKAAKRQQHPFGDDPLFRRFFGDNFGAQDERQLSLGSGVIVSPDGYILTNNHVIEGADEIMIELQKRADHGWRFDESWFKPGGLSLSELEQRRIRAHDNLQKLDLLLFEATARALKNSGSLGDRFWAQDFELVAFLAKFKKFDEVIELYGARGLTHVGARTTIAAGVLENTPEHMHEWIKDPSYFKPGNKMYYAQNLQTVGIVAQRIDTAMHVGTHFDGAMHATDNRSGDGEEHEVLRRGAAGRCCRCRRSRVGRHPHGGCDHRGQRSGLLGGP